MDDRSELTAEGEASAAGTRRNSRVRNLCHGSFALAAREPVSGLRRPPLLPALQGGLWREQEAGLHGALEETPQRGSSFLCTTSPCSGPRMERQPEKLRRKLALAQPRQLNEPWRCQGLCKTSTAAASPLPVLPAKANQSQPKEGRGERQVPVRKHYHPRALLRQN